MIEILQERNFGKELWENGKKKGTLVLESFEFFQRGEY
jgi:hypothetical protein